MLLSQPPQLLCDATSAQAALARLARAQRVWQLAEEVHVEALLRRCRQGSPPREVLLHLLLLCQPGSLRAGCLSRCACVTAHPGWRRLVADTDTPPGRCSTHRRRRCGLPPAKPPRLLLPRQQGPSGLT